MKRRIYYIISAILQILLGIYLLCSLQQLVDLFLNSSSQYLGMYPADTQERALNIIRNNGKIYLGIISSIPIILNLIILKIAISNRIPRNKGALISASIISFLFSNHVIGMILSLCSFIVSLCIVRKNPEDFPEKKEIPNVEYEKPSKKEIIWSIILVLVYFLQFGFKLIPNSAPVMVGLGLFIFYYVGIFILSIFTFKNVLKRDLKLFKNNFVAYIKTIFIGFAIYFPIYYLAFFIGAIITKQGVSSNQTSVEALPLYVSAPLAIIWAPIVEESIFRGALRRFIKNSTVFVIISAIAFGLIHTITSEDTIVKVLALSLPYACMGGFAAYMYKKTNNFCTSIFIHFFINIIAIIMTILF